MARLQISDVFHSSTICRRKSDFGQTFSILWNKLRLLDIIFKHVGFSPPSPTTIAVETPFSKICPRDKRRGGMRAANSALWAHISLCIVPNAWTAIIVRCSIYNVHIKHTPTLRQQTIQHNTDITKQTLPQSFTEPSDDACVRSHFVITGPKPSMRLTQALTPCISRFRWSVAGLSQRRPKFSARPVQVGFVVDNVQRDKFSSEYLGFPLSVSFHQCSILIHPSPTLLFHDAVTC